MDDPEPQRYTYDDLDSFDPAKRWELIDGIPYGMAGASYLHQAVVGELYMALRAHFGRGRCKVVLAPFDVKFTEGSFLTRGVYGVEHTLQSRVFPELSIDLNAIAEALPPQPPIEDEVRETVPTYADSRG